MQIDLSSTLEKLEFQERTRAANIIYVVGHDIFIVKVSLHNVMWPECVSFNSGFHLKGVKCLVKKIEEGQLQTSTCMYYDSLIMRGEGGGGKPLFRGASAPP